MAKLTKSLYHKLSQIIFGSVLSGILMFQGTGFITSNLYAANVNVDVTGGATIDNRENNTGLTGNSGATTVVSTGNIVIQNAAEAVLGVLDTEGTLISDVLQEVDLTLGTGTNFWVGYVDMVTPSNTDTKQQGFLNVSGNGTDDGSELIVQKESYLWTGAGGHLIIGGPSGSGTVTVLDGGQLLNLGSSNSTTGLTGGITINSNGVLNIGSDTEKTTYNTLDGDGELRNYGALRIYNETGSANRAYIGVYSDSTDATLFSTGKVMMNGGFGIGGELTVNGTMSVHEWESLCDTVFASSSKVTVTELATLGDEIPGAGANLTVGGDSALTSANVILGGLKIFGNSETMTGTLTLDEDSMMSINGLTQKMDFDGNLVDDGIYDVWLNSVLNVNGTLITKSASTETPGTVGIRFRSSAAGNAVVSSTGSILADNLILAGDHEVEGDIATFQNEGTFIVNGTLDLVSGAKTGGFNFLNIADSGAGSWIDALELTAKQTFTNGTAARTGVGIDINNLTLSGGLLESYSDSVMRVANLTIDTTETAASVTTGETSTLSVHNLNLNRGLMKLSSTDESTANGLTAYSQESVFNIGKTGQDNSDIAEIMLTGGNATFDRGTVNLNGQGLILAEEGSTLTFTDVTVNNNSERNGYALSADTLVFSGNSIYNGGKTVRADNMTFETGATLALGVNDNLTFDENGVLTLESGSILAVDFSDTENGMVTLTGNGTTNFEEGSIIRVANASSLAEGDYTNRTLVTTETEDNIFESTYEDTAFFSLTGTVEGTNLVLNLNVKKNFADLGTTPNEVAVGEYIDSFRMDSENVSEDLQLLLDDVMAQKDAALVAQTLDSFSGVNRANSMMLAMNNPWQAPFHQLVFGNHKGRCCVMETGCPVCPGQQMQCDSACDAPCDDCGMGTSALFHSAERIPHNAWFTTRYTSFNANSDGNSEKYGISDTGLNLGYDWINCNDTKVGLVFGYAQPYLYSHSNRIHMSNFQLGVYGGHEFADGWETRVYFGFGIQEYTNKRTFNEAGHTERFRTVYDGNTLAGSFQLGRSFQVSPLSLFRPFVQFDSQQVWQQGADETGGAAALIYQSGDWNRTFVRGGIETEFNTMFLQFTSRFNYACQIGGRTAPDMQAMFAGVTTGEMVTIRGVDLGESFFEAGGGALGYLDCERHWSVSGNYDFAASKQSTAHTGMLSLSYLY